MTLTEWGKIIRARRAKTRSSLGNFKIAAGRLRTVKINGLDKLGEQQSYALLKDTVNELTLHSSKPVVCGEKWVATQ
ncbi:hypothetical protein GCM10027018_05560 [Paenibacillus thermoaerophilus]